MQFGVLGLLVAAVAAAIAALGLLFGFDVAKAADYLGTASFVLFVVLVIVEFRRRSKRFSKK